MRYLFWLVLLAGGIYWGYDHFFGVESVPAAVSATTAVVATTGTTAAVATGAVVGAVVATGFWATLWAGGWFLGEMSFFLWSVLGCFILVPLAFIGWLCELPEEEDDLANGGRIFFSLILFGVMLALLSWGGIPLWRAISEHWIFASFSFIVFVAVGVSWSMYKYDRFAARCKEDISRVIEGFCAKYGLKVDEVAQEVGGKLKFTLSQEYKERWAEYFEHGTRRGRVGSSGATADSPVILFRRNKERISLWILFWPVSMVRGFIKDILVEALDALIRSLRRVYEAIAQRHAIEVVYVGKADAEKPAEPSGDHESGTPGIY